MTRRHRTLFSLLFFMSGAAGLIYEVCWTRLLRLPMGNTVYSMAAVLTAFMGGLALGSWIAGRRIDRGGQPLRIYAMLEAAIGVFCLALPWIVAGQTPLFRWAYRSFGDAFLAFQLFKFFACALVILVPATLMGATLPVLCRSFFDDSRRIGRSIGWLYAINALGAVLGSLLAGFVLVPGVGQRATIWIGVAISLTVASIAWLSQRQVHAAARSAAGVLPKSKRPPATSPAPARPNVSMPQRAAPRTPLPVGGRLRNSLLVAYGLSGLSAMVLQIAWARVLSLAFGSSVYAFALLVAAFILGLAIGSAVAARVADRLARPALGFAVAVLGIGFTALAMVPVLQHFPIWMLRIVPSLANDFSRFQLAQFGLVFVALLLPTLCMGACLPLVGRAMVRELDHAAESVGVAYSANAVGTIVGSFAGAFVFLPLLGMHGAILSGAAIDLTAGIVLLLLLLPRRQAVPIAAAACAAGLAAIIFLPRFDAATFTSGTYLYADRLAKVVRHSPGGLRGFMESENRILMNREGLGATITIKETSGGIRTLSINGKADASDDLDMATQMLAGHLPSLLHPAPRDVAVIGLASGVSAHAVAQYPTVRSIDCIEIAPEMPQACRYFEHVNGKILDDPRVHVILQDGRNHMTLTDRQYDIIVSEPSNPWIAGIASLFTREFLQACHDRLRPGGVMCLWIHVYGLDAHAIRSVARTFLDVFPDATLWESIFASDYQLVGVKGPLHVSWTDFQARTELPGVAADLARVGLHTPAEVLLRNLTDAAGMQRFAAAGEIYHDDRNRLEFDAPRLMHQITKLETLRELQSLRQPGLASWIEPPPGGLAAADRAAIEAAQAGQRAFWEGVVARMNGNDADATRLLLTGLERCAGLHDAWPQLLETLRPTVQRAIAAGDTVAALHLYERMVRLEPPIPDIYNEYGVLLGSLGRLADAQHCYEQALALRPQNVPARLNLATALALQGRASEAEPLLQTLVTERPENARAQVMLGNIAMQRKDGVAAERAFRSAARTHPETGQIWYLLGEALRQQDDCRGAIEAYQTAVSRDPNLAVANRAMAACYQKLGDNEKAASAVARAGAR